MSSSVEKIKERLSITDVVSSYVKLEKAGSGYKAKCPFHNEKSPSFFVSPDRGTYYCFGCGAKGDIFTFVEEFEGIEFRQALTNLADKAGVELVPEKAGEKSEKESQLHAMELATDFFETELQANSGAHQYLLDRGLSSETIAKWRLGYAKNEWRTLSDYLKTKGVSEATMLAVGLIKKSDTDSQQSFYDVFRGRIMFPIFDPSGRPVAFSGRILVDDEKSPKYLNSPATALFNKSEALYGFDRAKSAIRKHNYGILVEGQMDLLMSHQAGLLNTVASSGTALTELHLRRLMRISPRIMFAFDSDSAGFNATRKSAELALQLGMEVKVAVLPRGEDPASLVAKSPDLWRKAIRDSKHIIDFYTDSLLSRNIERRSLSREIKNAVLPFVLDVQSTTEQAHFMKSISEKSGLKEEALWDDLKNLSRSEKLTVGVKVDANPRHDSTQATRQIGIERRILGVLMWQESKSKPEIGIEHVRQRLREILGEETAQSIETAAQSEKDKLIFEAEQYYEHGSRFERDVEELFINLEEEILKEKLSRYMVELHKAELIRDHKRAEEFLIQCQGVNTKLAALRKK